MIAADAQGMVQAAAGNAAGLTIGRQLREACRNLGYRDGHWRIRAAWYGEAECWSARALEDLRARYRAWEARQAALAAAIDEKHVLLLRVSASALEAGSDEAMDRQDARRMRSHAERLEHARSTDEDA